MTWKRARSAIRQDYRPHIEMVPMSLWGSNMRGLMTRMEWRSVRQALLDVQGVTCAICGKVETAPRRVYAHEEWAYDETTEPATASITGVSLVCWHCHACEHWGCTNALVRERNLTRALQDTIAHFCRLNDATEKDFEAHQADAAKVWRRRCGRKWRIDYGIFAEWTAKTFKGDPLNGGDWPSSMPEEWMDEDRPTMAEIVSLARETGRGERGRPLHHPSDGPPPP